MRLRTSLILSAGLVLLSGPTYAASVEPAPGTTAGCAAHADTLAEAQRLFAGNEPAADHAALGCLLEELRRMRADAPLKQRSEVKAVNIPTTTLSPK